MFETGLGSYFYLLVLPRYFAWMGHFRLLWLKLMITSDGLRGNCVIVWTLNKDSAAPGGQVNPLSTRVTK